MTPCPVCKKPSYYLWSGHGGCTECIEAKRWAPPTAAEKPSNPKDALGSTRAPLHLLPLPALVAWSLAHFEGGSKYGFWNWTIVGVRASIYVAAAARHLFKWFFGQSKDPVTGVHHLGYVMACCAIIIDAEHRQKLEDDRPPALPNLDALFDDAEATVKKLIALYGDRNPRHFTIADSAVREAGKPAAEPPPCVLCRNGWRVLPGSNKVVLCSCRQPTL